MSLVGQPVEPIVEEEYQRINKLSVSERIKLSILERNKNEAELVKLIELWKDKPLGEIPYNVLSDIVYRI